MKSTRAYASLSLFNGSDFVVFFLFFNFFFIVAVVSNSNCTHADVNMDFGIVKASTFLFPTQYWPCLIVVGAPSHSATIFLIDKQSSSHFFIVAACANQQKCNHIIRVYFIHSFYSYISVCIITMSSSST